MNQESPSRFEPNNQILAAPIDGRDALALELSRDLVGIRGARQPRIRDPDMLEDRPSRTGASRRLTLSTSGSSGTQTR